MTATTSIPGYTYGQSGVPRSPVTLDELRQLEETVGWTNADAELLKRHQSIFVKQAEKMVDAWRAVIASQPHLAKWFFDPNGKPDEDYKKKVKARFVQWVSDVALLPHDQQWLDYQEEIGLRHTPKKKNQTDGAHTPSHVPMRYLVGFVPLVVTTSRQFFLDAGLQGEDLRQLEDAWLRAVQLHVTLWTRPYTQGGLW